MRHILTGARIFDGTRLLDNHALALDGDVIEAILPADQAPADATSVAGIIMPGFVDLQVNGGGGLMVDGQTDAEVLRQICATHLRLGCAGILPTLITDTPAATEQVIAAGVQAARENVPGFLGLHLEGPHLDPRRKGAHDPHLIRPMGDADLSRMTEAAQQMPVLMVTLAPEAATPGQISALSEAGVIVSLGHSDCSLDTAREAQSAGARFTTHLFNAMSQMGHREPGMVGAALTGDGFVGLIADGIHVHPAAMQVALAARPSGVVLVSDCMAFAGTDLTQMTLNDRPVLRRDGRLTLTDGTLAGADLRLDRAIQVLVDQVGIPLDRALAMATSEPARAVGLGGRLGHLAPGRAADLLLLDSSLTLKGIWQDGGWQRPLPA
ncbi:N-acetylglucosamine-6-phosphate deacetylase [Paracoccus fistulariae]|uniref:N-acetylglucosamine-6-phosphate deacetylase n=1 Tax=Paracoccus fistulariae TaxID=658446 RepID=A0ABY7SFB2_9RHOB|nr:N-acetylglucosamine-6-phosphate deacetylase [Paracoccus fistulariae]MDB6182716.1 N-acetylglucosamine-6-phosphate deacetylase [Paracoccus fistulariae]WCR05720.1 N-acetylglucosamine-6-phosphate deacetylase [Paracoccus fistulariae]